MAKDKNQNLKQAVIINGRENTISYTLFRNAVGKRMGLNSTDFTCLDLLFYKGTSSPSELAKYTGLSSGSTTAMLDRLAKLRMIKRTRNPDDRRGTLVIINKKGAKKFSPLFLSARKAQAALLHNYSSAELEIISRYFNESAQMFDSERKKLDSK
jgi:DNA-binding MarR family transcriptional regulator